MSTIDDGVDPRERPRASVGFDVFIRILGQITTAHHAPVLGGPVRVDVDGRHVRCGKVVYRLVHRLRAESAAA